MKVIAIFSEHTEIMGLFHLQVPDQISRTLPPEVWDSIHFCGSGGTPWQTIVEKENNQLEIGLKVSSSGKVHILWPVEGLGSRVLATCTLAPSKTKSYNLVTELARGSCHRARMLAAEWNRLGIHLSELFVQHLTEGTACFLKALKHDDSSPESIQESTKAILHLELAVDSLADEYANYCIDQRKQRDPRLTTLLAGSMLAPASFDSSSEVIPMQELYLQTFNTAAVRLNWREIEIEPNKLNYAPVEKIIEGFDEIGLRTISGPLIDFETELLPEWVLNFSDHFDALQQASINFVERTVSHLKGKAQLWNCMSGINTSGPFYLDDEQIMRLSLSILQTVRHSDPETPAIVSFNEPFGEYLRKPHGGIPGLKVAETLQRCGLGLAGIGLDIKLNYSQTGSMQRSAMDFSQNLDRWSALGLPLLIQLTAPAGSTNDPYCIAHQQGRENQTPFQGVDMSSHFDDMQLRVIKPILPILLAKPYVHGIVWNGWSDGVPHHSPNAGLLDQSGTPRPLQKYLRAMRADHLS